MQVSIQGDWNNCLANAFASWVLRAWSGLQAKNSLKNGSFTLTNYTNFTAFLLEEITREKARYGRRWTSFGRGFLTENIRFLVHISIFVRILLFIAVCLGWFRHRTHMPESVRLLAVFTHEVLTKGHL